MIGQMIKSSRAIFMMGVLAISLFGNSSASALSQAAQSPAAQSPAPQPPERALLNLHKVAESMITDPGKEYDKTTEGDFPYPSAIQAQWYSSMAAYGTKLSPQQHDLFPECGTHLNAAITDMEIGYRIKISHPPNDPAQEDVGKLYGEAKTEFAKCDEAYKLAQSQISNAPANPPQQSGAAANGEAVAGTAAEAALPGSIDWTPALNPLQQYLSNEWQRVINDPKNSGWAPDNAGNTVTLKLQPNEVPAFVSQTGARGNTLESIMQNSNIPKTRFPEGSKLTFIRIAPTFYVNSVPSKFRMRLKYYEREGIFKSYQAPL